MLVRTPVEIGLVIRERRRALKLNQDALARKAGVGRQWIVEIEGGKPRAEVGLVFRTPSAPGLDLNIKPAEPFHPSSDDVAPVDLITIIEIARKNTLFPEKPRKHVVCGNSQIDPK